MTTSSGIEFVPLFRLAQISALGKVQTDLPALCHTLPPSAGVDGVLGLNFFEGTRLTLDFAAATITIT